MFVILGKIISDDPEKLREWVHDDITDRYREVQDIAEKISEQLSKDEARKKQPMLLKKVDKILQIKEGIESAIDDLRKIKTCHSAYVQRNTEMLIGGLEMALNIVEELES